VHIKHQFVVFDAADLATERAFRAGVLNGAVRAEDHWCMVCVDAAPRLGVQLALNHVPPGWPYGSR
jgi:hypothetical protein